MGWLVRPLVRDDLVRLLSAWRLWILATFAGAVLAAGVYFLAPPPYRARATVLVDFNLEQARPAETDRQHFYYLERETRKLEEIAWSDSVMLAVANGDAAQVRGLREGRLQLGQPGEGGWHFYADGTTAQAAASLASAWAETFAGAAQARIAESGGLDSHIEVQVTQSAQVPVARSVPVGSYLLAGAGSAWFLAAFLFLFFGPTTRRAVA